MRRIKGWICAILLLTVVVLCLPLPAALRLRGVACDTILPYQSFALLLRVHLIERGSLLFRAATALERIHELETEIASLNYRNRELSNLKRENVWLRQQLDFRNSYSSNMVCCGVISRGGSSGWWESIRLNRGTDHKIALNQPVVTSEGLVGRISKVSARTCDVLLISDPKSRVACEFDFSGDLARGVRGIVQGSGARPAGRTRLEMLFALDPLRMTYINNEAIIPVDAKVVTSGLGGVYPRGLSVGIASDVTQVESGLYLEAKVVPVADLASLSYVFVLLEVVE